MEGMEVKEIKEDKTKLVTTIKEIASDIGIPYKQVYNDVKSGKLRAVRRGRTYYISTDDAGRYIYEFYCELKGIKPVSSDKMNILLDTIMKGVGGL